jgi:hypothetical protein
MKSKLTVIFSASFIVTTALLALSANARTALPTLEKLNQTRSHLQQTINSLDKDLKQGAKTLIKETVTDKTKQITDVFTTEEEIVQKILSTLKDSIFDTNPKLKAQTATQEWQKLYIREQAKSHLGNTGQELIQQEQELSLALSQNSGTQAQAAQGDVTTQKVMKRLAVQNAQNTNLLKLVQTSVQRQNQLTATSNLSLSGISRHLQNRDTQQLEEQKAIRNVLHTNSRLRSKLWNYGLD